MGGGFGDDIEDVMRVAKLFDAMDSDEKEETEVAGWSCSCQKDCPWLSSCCGHTCYFAGSFGNCQCDNDVEAMKAEAAELAREAQLAEEAQKAKAEAAARAAQLAEEAQTGETVLMTTPS